MWNIDLVGMTTHRIRIQHFTQPNCSMSESNKVLSSSETTPLTREQWQQCLEKIGRRMAADGKEQDFNTWVRPLQCEHRQGQLYVLAPNRFVHDWVARHYMEVIQSVLSQSFPEQDVKVHFAVGASTPKSIVPTTQASAPHSESTPETVAPVVPTPNLNTLFTFDNFVVGPGNELAKAAADQVSQNPGDVYNPLFIYGGAGLGKTHLMHAIANTIHARNPSARIRCVHSERFVSSMVKALQNNSMEQFKSENRDVDVFLFDDVQFIAQKPRTQVEFFHTFNALLDAQGSQIVLTCDRYPKELEGFESRLISRFSGGLTVAIEPPDLETRVAILMNKAEMSQTQIPQEVAFFIAKRIRSNVRELEGALKRVIASAHFTGQAITLDFANQALKDLLAVQAKSVSLDNIQRTTAKYYNIKLADLLSKNRSRSFARPRQLAMLLAKELTAKSLPEIGDAFGGRDHTTVLHACRKMKSLIKENESIKEDYMLLQRILSS